MLEGRLVSVIGARRSGIAAAILLRDRGAAVFVSDSAPIAEQEREMLRNIGVVYEENGHSEKVLDADFAIVSPGISPTAPVIQRLEEEGMTIHSEIELASWVCPAPIVGVTGTDGKTTTALLIAAICGYDGAARGYHAFSAGNIGVPFSSVVGKMTQNDIAVVELSSYQLERCDTFHPEVAVITNIMPDHLDRYGGSLERYSEAKYRIFRNQRPNDWLVYNYDNPTLRERFSGGGRGLPGLFPFSTDAGRIAADSERYATVEDEGIVTVIDGQKERVIGFQDLFKRSFRGSHNLENVLAAAAAARVLRIGASSAHKALGNFAGVEHRQELVGTSGGIEWINDSKATNLNALRRALQSVPGNILLIAGGRAKGDDFSDIAGEVRERVSKLVVFGESKETIAGALSPFIVAERADSLEEAVELCRSSACKGDTVLFSPGCSSFDMFENFEERGKAFKDLVREFV